MSEEMEHDQLSLVEELNTKAYDRQNIYVTAKYSNTHFYGRMQMVPCYGD